MSSVAAVGDNHNDIEMLQLAGWGIAMRNAKPEVKAVADEVSEPQPRQSPGRLQQRMNPIVNG